MFVDIIKVFILLWLATDNNQQSYQRLTQTSERARFVAFRTFCAYYVNWVVIIILIYIAPACRMTSHCYAMWASKG